MLPAVPMESTTTVVVETMLTLSPEEDKNARQIMSGLGIGLDRNRSNTAMQSKLSSHAVTRQDLGSDKSSHCKE